MTSQQLLLLGILVGLILVIVFLFLHILVPVKATTNNTKIQQVIRKALANSDNNNILEKLDAWLDKTQNQI